eukprot:375556-Prymnesium_polylepis.2
MASTALMISSIGCSMEKAALPEADGRSAPCCCAASAASSPAAASRPLAGQAGAAAPPARAVSATATGR